MKVLVINTDVFKQNGMSTIIMNYYHQLKKKISLDFTSIGEMDFFFQEQIAKKTNVYLLPPRKKKVLSYILELRKVVKENNYDIIHIHGNSSLMAIEQFAIKNMGNFKVIVHCHGSQSNYGFIEKFTRKYFCKHYDKAITVELEKSYLFNEGEYEVLNNGIVMEKYYFDERKRNKLRSDFGLDDCTVLLHVGRMNNQKNHMYLLKMFKDYLNMDCDAKLILIGSGMHENKIINKISDLEITDSVILLGDVEEVFNWYSVADVFVFPSLYEPFGLVAIEAQVNSLPCVFSNKVSQKIQVTDFVAYLPIEEKDIGQWVKLISEFKLLRKDQLRFELNNLMLQFDITHSANKLLSIYEKLM